jgi:hypothetical protein
MPQAWGSDRRDEECASERKTDKPLGGGVKPPRDAGRRSFEGGKEVIKRGKGRLSPP